MKILFCTDGSESSYNSISNFSKWFNNITVDILSVSDMTYFSDEMLMNNNKITELCSNSVDNILKTSEKILKDKGINCDNFIKKCGSAVDAILEQEKAEIYDCIVMGSNGKRGIQKWLGSVSQEVAYQSKTCVYISKNSQMGKNVLFPVFPELNDKSNLGKLISNMNLYDAMISIMSVYKMPDFLFYFGNSDSNWISDVESKQQKEAVVSVKDNENLFNSIGFDVKDKLVVKGDPFEEIMNYSEANNISLIVTGMRNKKNSTGNISISRKILEYTDSDILIDKNI